ncbi:MAG: hypothetical protein A2Y75_02640 [Candidatus Solincola sediminis]|uniref:MoaD/ThiS family protein n=1 Tax=Candidatus Solincola sediminis TaxID=1797199 RepID=A0A1F2WJQ3_9ACTN|nr:MAG: hypothetical protein A2Y75_02640 [Candidatus Solincola sediminis]
MQVKVHFVGMFKHHTKDAEKEYELREEATVGELLLAVGRDYGRRLPEQMWDAAGERFHPTISAVRKGSTALESEEQLKEGDEIYIFTRMAGG